MIKEVYIVVWENEEAYVYNDEASAVKQVERITGKERNKWAYDNGDYDDYGNQVWYNEASMEGDS